MRSMNPRRWNPERPASIGCALSGYTHEKKEKEDLAFEKIANEDVRKISLFKDIEQRIKLELAKEAL